MEEAFKHFDKDGCGSITAQGFSTGLREMGVFQEFSQEEVDEVRAACAAGTATDFGNIHYCHLSRLVCKDVYIRPRAIQYYPAAPQTPYFSLTKPIKGNFQLWWGR